MDPVENRDDECRDTGAWSGDVEGNGEVRVSRRYSEYPRVSTLRDSCDGPRILCDLVVTGG